MPTLMPPGTMPERARRVLNGILETLQAILNGDTLASSYGVVGDGVTDDRAAMQAAIDYAIANGSRRLIIGPGTYLIDGTLEIKPTAGFAALEMRGANGSFLGRTRLVHGASQLLNPLIAIQAGRSVRIRDLELRGNNTAPSTINVSGAYNNGDPAAWLSAGVSERQYAPYAGICIDGLAGSDPGAGANYTYGTYGQGTSSDIVVQDCRIQNFAVACAVHPAANDSGSEGITFRNCNIVENKYAYVTTGTQQRNVVVEQGTINGHWCGFDGVTFGMQKGQPPTVRDVNIGHVYRLLQLSADSGSFVMEGGYCESVSTIGIIGALNSSARCAASFDGVNFSLIGLDDDGATTNKDAVLKNYMPATFTGCMIQSQFVMLVYPGQPVKFEGCLFGCESNDNTLTPGDRERFGIYTPPSFEHLVRLTNCAQRVYAGTTKYLDDDVRLTTIPARAYLMPNATGLSRLTDRARFKLTPPNEARTATIDTVAYPDDETVTFNETTAVPIIREGDLLYWRINLPVVPGASGETAIMPALKVADVTGAAITCQRLADIDTTYAPASVDIRIPLFVNATPATGDTTNGSADIANVTDIANFQVGDWVQFSDTGVFSSPVRIDGISGTTLTMHRTLSKTTVGVSIYNTLLTAL